MSEGPLLAQGAPGCQPSPPSPHGPAPHHVLTNGHVTHRAGPVAAAALVAPMPVAFVAFLRVNALLDLVFQVPAAPDFTNPTPIMSASHVEV